MIEELASSHELADFANQIGNFICYWGFKRIHGRVWTYIYLSCEPVDAGFLMKHLKVSKALISLTLNDLLRHEVILEAGKSPRGTQTYRANPDILGVIGNILRVREHKMLLKIEASHRALAGLTSDKIAELGVQFERLKFAGQMIDQAQLVLSSMLELTNIDMKIWKELASSIKDELLQQQQQQQQLMAAGSAPLS